MEQDELLGYSIELLERLNVTYMLVGSLASGVYGEPRLTQDIDIVISPTARQLDEMCDEFPRVGFYVSREAAHEALRRRDQFNVLDPSSGNKIDFMLARSDKWGIEQLARRERTRLLPDREGFAARPEDVILSKMQYFQEGRSEKHLRDIAGMLKTSNDRIDRGYVERWAEELGLAVTWHDILALLGR